jgi:hypothetical protein
MGYEVSTELLVPYIEFILGAEKDPNEERWGTYEEKSHKVREELTRVTRKRKNAKTSTDQPSEVLKRRRELVEGITSSQACSKQDPPKAAEAIKTPIEGITREVEAPIPTKKMLQKSQQETTPMQTR